MAMLTWVGGGNNRVDNPRDWSPSGVPQVGDTLQMTSGLMNINGYTRYGAKSWGCERRVVARIEASTQGLDIRYVVTNLDGGSAEWLYDTLYCARGQAENLIKLHMWTAPPSQGFFAVL